AAWPYADKISSIDALKGRRISIDLRLKAFLIQLPYDLLNASSSVPARARSLSQGERGRRKDQDGYDNCSSHGEFTSVNYSLACRSPAHYVQVEAAVRFHSSIAGPERSMQRANPEDVRVRPPESLSFGVP